MIGAKSADRSSVKQAKENSLTPPALGAKFSNVPSRAKAGQALAVFNVSHRHRCFMALVICTIKQEGLILAQDERWRRA